MASGKPETTTPPPAGEPARLALRPREAAAALGIGTRKLWELTNSKKIPHLKLGACTLYPVAQLAEWLARQAEGGGR